MHLGIALLSATSVAMARSSANSLSSPRPGYEGLTLADHVLGGNPGGPRQRPCGWARPSRPFVAFGFIGCLYEKGRTLHPGADSRAASDCAGCKQAASLDVLSGGASIRHRRGLERDGIVGLTRISTTGASGPKKRSR